jgi:hypothetical protein
LKGERIRAHAEDDVSRPPALPVSLGRRSRGAHWRAPAGSPMAAATWADHRTLQKNLPAAVLRAHASLPMPFLGRHAGQWSVVNVNPRPPPDQSGRHQKSAIAPCVSRMPQPVCDAARLGGSTIGAGSIDFRLGRSIKTCAPWGAVCTGTKDRRHIYCQQPETKRCGIVSTDRLERSFSSP